MADLKTYYAAKNACTGSTGFTNFFGCDMEKGLAEVFKEHPKAVVIDGTDDWFAPIYNRPATWITELRKKPIALFHSGVSGISRSGIVIWKKDLRAVMKAYEKKYRVNMIGQNRLYVSCTKKSYEEIIRCSICLGSKKGKMGGKCQCCDGKGTTVKAGS